MTVVREAKQTSISCTISARIVHPTIHALSNIHCLECACSEHYFCKERGSRRFWSHELTGENTDPWCKNLPCFGMLQCCAWILFLVED